jgi:hypothetical protein
LVVLLSISGNKKGPGGKRPRPRSQAPDAFNDVGDLTIATGADRRSSRVIQMLERLVDGARSAK